MEVNHYGRWVDSEVAVTGVIDNNKIEWLSDEIYGTNSIDLAWEEFMEGNPTEEEQESWGDYDSDYHEYLIGGWHKDCNGMFEPNKNEEYSAIVRETTTQVVWSRYTKRCALCSPCYVGQGDLDSDGDFLAFDLPEDLKGNNNG